jgi:hypothetical protein
MVDVASFQDPLGTPYNQSNCSHGPPSKLRRAIDVLRAPLEREGWIAGGKKGWMRDIEGPRATKSPASQHICLSRNHERSAMCRRDPCITQSCVKSGPSDIPPRRAGQRFWQRVKVQNVTPESLDVSLPPRLKSAWPLQCTI